VLAFARPKTMIIREILPSGLTLVSEAMPHVRSVAIGVWLKRGSRHEPAEQAGISHFIEHMVFKGTRHRSAEQIASEVDSIGGHMDAFTAKEFASFHLKVLDEHLPLAVDILGDIVRNPLFDAAEMTKEKKVIFEEINMVEDTPDDLVMELFVEAFWPGHPLGRPILGTKESVGRFDREELAGFFRGAYHPSNLLVAAAGRLEHGAVRDLVERHFGSLPEVPDGRDASPPRPAAGLVTRSKQELEQVHLCLGVPAYSQAQDERYTAHVLNTVLGGSLSSRLFQNIREKRGLAYAISSGLASYSDAGSLTIYAGTGLDSIDPVLRLTLVELRRLQDEPVPADELRRAKDHLKGSLMLALESTSSRMNHIARHEIYHGRQVGLDEILERIEGVEADAVQRIAVEMFEGPRTLTLLGNLQGYRPDEALLRG